MTGLPQRERLRLLGLRHGPHYTTGIGTPARPPAAAKAGTMPKAGK
jgi:hypothetical protein